MTETTAESPTTTLGRDGRLIFATRAVRMFGYGLASWWGAISVPRASTRLYRMLSG